jgi:CheY-like chemotaxis protein
MSGRKTILVADDCLEDVTILKRAFIKSGIDVPFTVVRDGQEAVRYLAGDDEFGDRRTHPLPQLMLLDLKMPRMDGFEVLRWLLSHPKLRRMPVAVLTSSGEDRDVNRAYDLGANSYVIKPASLSGYAEIAGHLHHFWMQINYPPECVR